MNRNKQEIFDGDNKTLPRIKLTPSPNGADCLGNGAHNDIAEEIRCDECSHYLQCYPEKGLTENG